MIDRGLDTDDRGISSVVGVILLVGITVAAMSVLATLLLGSGFISSPPSAEFVYVQNGTDEVYIVADSAKRIDKDTIEIRLRGAGTCTAWNESGELESGDVMKLESSDCPESLESGDVIQVVASTDGTLPWGGIFSDTTAVVDSYELRET